MATACSSPWMYSQSSGSPCCSTCFAASMSGQVMVSRPSPMAWINASFTVFLIDAPVAYGEMIESCSRSPSVSWCFTRLR